MANRPPISDSSLEWFDREYDSEEDNDFEGYWADAYPTIRARMRLAEDNLKLAIEILRIYADDTYVTNYCNRSEHDGWYDGHGEWCADCGSYEAREFKVVSGPNKAKEMLIKLTSLK